MRKVFYLGSLVVLAWAIAVVPIPGLVLAPGAPLLVADGERPDEEPLIRAPERGPLTGELRAGSFVIVQVTTFGLVRAWMDPHSRPTLAPLAAAPGLDLPAQIEIERQLFEESILVASVAGLRAAGHDVPVEAAGARILHVLPGSPADGHLRPGDVVTDAGGQPVRVRDDLVARIRERAAGEDLELTVQRRGEVLRLTVTIAHVPALAGPGLGVVASSELAADLPITLEVDEHPEAVGGSAALAIALAVYDLASDDDLAAGRVIAATGGLDLDGNVLRVEAVGLKAIGAAGAGVQVFLVPEEQEDEARAAVGDRLIVIAVGHLDDAVAALLEASPGR